MESQDSLQKKTGTGSESGLQFVDEKFDVQMVAPTSAPVKPGTESTEKGPGVPAPTINVGYVPDYTEEELLFLSESLWGIPGMFFEKLPERNPEKIKKWNHHLYLYCVKKGINPFEYVADELPLVIITAGLASGLWRDYRDAYRNGAGKDKTKEKPADKTPSDIEMEKRAAEQKAAHIEQRADNEGPNIEAPIMEVKP